MYEFSNHQQGETPVARLRSTITKNKLSANLWAPMQMLRCDSIPMSIVPRAVA